MASVYEMGLNSWRDRGEMGMLEEWGNTIVWALGACTTIIAFAEFYGGKELQQWIKVKLEDWWLRLSYIRMPNVGLAEAVFTERILRTLLGKTFSMRRLLASSAFAVLLIVAGFLAMAQVYKPQLDVMSDTVSEHWRELLFATFPLLMILIFVSLALTYTILVRSISWWSNTPNATFFFLLTLVASVAITAQVSTFVEMFMVVDEFQLGEEYNLDEPDSKTLFLVAVHLAMLLMNRCLFWLRLGLFSIFALWLLSGYFLVVLKLTIFRLFEAEKGALTVFSAVLTAAAAGIKWWMEQIA